ncbi:hypothetical protein HN51_037906 [Arachis hypogaea]
MQTGKHSPLPPTTHINFRIYLKMLHMEIGISFLRVHKMPTKNSLVSRVVKSGSSLAGERVHITLSN